MDDFISTQHFPVVINRAKRTIITMADEEYRFIQDGNRDKERFYGLLFYSYRTCGNYSIDERLKALLDTHIRRDG